MRSTSMSHLAMLTAIALVTLPACSPQDQSVDEGTEVANPADGLELQFGVQAASYAPGDSIRALVRVVNRGAEPRTLNFPSSQRFDILVLDSAGVAIHSWSMDKSFAQAIEEETLAPGEELLYEGAVVAPPVPGNYQVRGVITASEASLESTLPVEVDR